MKLGDKEMLFWLGVGIAVLLLLLWLFGRRGSGGTGDGGAMSPYDWTVPGFPSLIDVTGGSYDINVPSTPLAWIAPYFPLFGFVGIDSTQIYQ